MSGRDTYSRIKTLPEVCPTHNTELELGSYTPDGSGCDLMCWDCIHEDLDERQLKCCYTLSEVHEMHKELLKLRREIRSDG